MKTASKKLSTFYILDLDRCLVNTDPLAVFFSSFVKKYDPMLGEKLDIERRLVEAAGHSFDVYTYLEKIIGADVAAIIDAFIIGAQKRDFLNIGAHDLMHVLDSSSTPYGILTYGSDAWQRVKIIASRLDRVPSLITQEKHKGKVISSWYDESSHVFKVPQALLATDARSSFDRIVLVDDKRVSFDTMPMQTTGYWYTNETSDNLAVISIADLRDVLVHENISGIDKL